MPSIMEAALVLTQNFSPPAVPGVDFAIVDQGDGKGQQIVFWDPRLGSVPTAEQLAAVTDQQVQAYRQRQAQTLAQTLLSDAGATGTALRAIYLAAGLTAQQVSAHLPAASGG
jgi:hypothetical protein